MKVMSKAGRITVLGLGSWGTALAEHLSRKGLECLGWSKSPEEILHISKYKRHPTLHTDIDLSFQVTEDLSLALKSDVIVFALPSSTIPEYEGTLSKLGSATIVSATKGFSPGTFRTTTQSFAHAGCNGERLCALSGPSFAADLIAKRPISLVAASIEEELPGRIAEIFSTESLRVYTSTDPIGVELGGALKNVIAVAAGICDGLDFGESARAGLVTRGLNEIMRIIESCGGRRETIFGLSGLGDLILTSSSSKSRNYTTGYRLGRGEKLDSILASLGQVAEGVHAASAALSLAKSVSVQAPITEGVVAVVEGQLSAVDLAKKLLSRPRKAEF